MRIKEIKGIVNDLMNVSSWKNPLSLLPVQPDKKYEINLPTGKLNVDFEDSITEYLIEKYKWFINRVKNLKGNLNDFEEARIIIYIRKEKVKIKYKKKNFEDEIIY
ncbi:MAG: hypothetical protein NUV46_04005 [Nanoarchaeota archaeon]|nr:hypothetical protein [Nanoarchaeota archaeon]